MTDNNIDILCLQEVEIEESYDPRILNLKDFDLELEVNSVKSRVGTYIGKKGQLPENASLLPNFIAKLVLVQCN